MILGSLSPRRPPSLLWDDPNAFSLWPLGEGERGDGPAGCLATAAAEWCCGLLGALSGLRGVEKRLEEGGLALGASADEDDGEPEEEQSTAAAGGAAEGPSTFS